MRRSAAPSALRSKITLSVDEESDPDDTPRQYVAPGPASLFNETTEDSSDQTRSASRILSLLTNNSASQNSDSSKDMVSEPRPPSFPKPKHTNSSANKIELKDEEQNEKEQTEGEETRIFEAVYRKMQTKKHKTWEGDGKVEVTDRQVILKDENGKEMGRIQKVKDDVILEEGAQLVIGGKEVEFLGLISKSMATKRKSDAPRAELSKKTKIQPRDNDEKEEWYLAMPKPTTKHQMLFNKKGLPVNTVTVDGFLAKSLRPHQREGITFMYQCVMGMTRLDPTNHQGVLLADEMGLGKTVQCISLFWTLLKQNVYGRDPAIRKILIITPSSLVRNWDKEIIYWLKLNRIKVYVVGEKQTLKEYRKQRLYPVAIVSYETLVKNMNEALQVNWDLIICDEAHRIKNPKTKISQELRRLQCSKRIILTGTPCQNNLMEYYELLDFANPGVLGTKKEFMAKYAGPIERGTMADASEETKEFGEKQKEELRRLTSNFVLGRPAEINIQYLPPKQDLVVFCPLTDLQKEMYEALINHYVGDADVRKEMDINFSSTNALCAISNLRKICSHPHLLLCKTNELEGENELKSLMKPICQKATNLKFVEKSGKMLVVNGILQFLTEANENKKKNLMDRVLIVSYFTETLNILQEMCGIMKIKFSRIDSNVSQPDRMKIVTDFNDPNSEIFLMLLSAKAGGTGLNLTGASRVILFDLDWNPANDAQSLARVWRGQQKRPVITYRLLTSGTVEEKIFQRQIQKIGYNPNKKSKPGISFTKEELKDLFSYNSEDENENPTHSILNCDCSCDGGNITDDQMCSEDSGMFEDDKLECKFPSIDELNCWQHFSKIYNPQLMEDLNLALVSEWVLFIFRSQLMCKK